MAITESSVDLDVTLLSATIGAEIRGIDLRRIWVERRVVFFPDQHPSCAPTPSRARRASS